MRGTTVPANASDTGRLVVINHDEGEPWTAETLLTVGYNPFALLVVSILIVS